MTLVRQRITYPTFSYNNLDSSLSQRFNPLTERDHLSKVNPRDLLIERSQIKSDPSPLGYSDPSSNRIVSSDSSAIGHRGCATYPIFESCA